MFTFTTQQKYAIWKTSHFTCVCRLSESEGSYNYLYMRVTQKERHHHTVPMKSD